MAGLWAQAMTHTMNLKRRPPATKESLTLRDQRALDGPVHGRGERIQTSGLCVPNAALYQAKLHPVDKKCNKAPDGQMAEISWFFAARVVVYGRGLYFFDVQQTL